MELHWLAKHVNPPEDYHRLLNFCEGMNRIEKAAAEKRKVIFSIEQKEPSIEKIIEKEIEKALKKYFK